RRTGHCGAVALPTIFFPVAGRRGFHVRLRPHMVASGTGLKRVGRRLRARGRFLRQRRGRWVKMTGCMRRAFGAWAIAVSAAIVVAPSSSSAETIESALVKAYQNNPQLNAQRASVRATDEAVPQALSGYRPRVSVNGSLGEQFTDTTAKSISGQPPTTPGGPVKNIATYTGTSGTVTPWTYGITGQQTLFNGFQTANRTRAAEGQVSAAREGLRVLDQTVLLNAATVYIDVLP